MGGGGVGVVDGALEDVLVNAGGVVVGLDLAAQVFLWSPVLSQITNTFIVPLVR